MEFPSSALELMDDPRFLGSAAIAAVVVFAMIVAMAFATGSTFGQRCAQVYEHGSADWHVCVERLSSL